MDAVADNAFHMASHHEKLFSQLRQFVFVFSVSMFESSHGMVPSL
jgi:hypothetical protein